MAFCDFVKELREQNQLTQAEMAEILDVNVNTIKQIEANKIKAPSNRVLDSFCNYLHEDRLTVMTKILFRRNDEIQCDNEYRLEQASVLSRYMSYLYLEGWNIDEAPAKYHTKDLGDLVYAGQLTKKREPNNKIVIKSIADYYDDNVNNLTSNEAIHYITFSMAAFFCIDEVSLKGIHIIFDEKNENHKKLFMIFKNLRLNKIPFNYQMILFDSVNGKILGKIEFK